MDAVRQVIEHRGLRQSWVADRLEISEAYLSRLLSGERPWTPELRERAAFWLGVPESLLFAANECTEKVQELDQNRTPEEAACQPK